MLVAAKDSKLGDVAIGQGFDLAKLLGDGRLAVGDVKSVPAGKYAKAALEKLGAWGGVESKLAQAENVRAALALVARGEAPLGIVYKTDAASDPTREDRRHLPGRQPSADHLPGRRDQGRRRQRASADFLKFLSSGTAKTAFEKQGFSLIGPASS